MATAPSQDTVAVADRILAATWNADVRDSVNFLDGQGSNPFPYCQVYNSGNISLTDATFTLITFDSEAWDTDTMHSTASNTSRVTFTTAGVYRVEFFCAFASNTTGRRAINPRLNAAGSSSGGTSLITWAIPPVNGTTTNLYLPITRRFSAADHIEMFAFQNSGGALNATGSSVPWLLGITAQRISA